MPSRTPDPTRFILDRALLADADDVVADDSYGGYSGYLNVNPSIEAAGFLTTARDAEAISSPYGLEVVAYALDDGDMLVAIRERGINEAATSERQLATLAFSPPESYSEAGFDAGCAVVEDLLARANRLLITYEILDYAERQVAAFGGGLR